MRRALGLLALGGVLVACSELIGLSKLEEGPAPPTDAGMETSIEGSSPADAGKEASFPASCFDGVKNNDESDVDCGGTCRPCRQGHTCNGNADCSGKTCSAGRCLGCATIPILGADAGCIDRTEVTVGDYGEFLADGQTLIVHDPACVNGATPTPVNWDQQVPFANRPVRNIDWCSASAYCKWRGKTLCRAMDGGRDGGSAWSLACASKLGLTYPYGGAYDPKKCNGADLGLGEPADVTQLSSCHKPGSEGSDVYDLSGNVAEWEDDCSPGGPTRPDRCAVRGGSYASDASALACAARAEEERDVRSERIGFRCCEPVFAGQ